MANERAYVGYAPSTATPYRIHVVDDSGEKVIHLTAEQGAQVLDDLTLLLASTYPLEEK